MKNMFNNVIFRKRAILGSVRFIWFLLFSEFLVTRKNVIQKTKGRGGQTKKTGFLLFFYCFKVRLSLTEEATVWASAFLF